MTSSILATYVAARSYAYLRSKASSFFARCRASISTIGKRIGQSESTVKRNLTTLQRAGLLYRRQRFNTSSVIAFVDFPERFQATWKQCGREAAEAENESRLEAIQEDAWVENAKNAHTRTFRNVGRRSLQDSIAVAGRPDRVFPERTGHSGDGSPLSERPPVNPPRVTGELPPVHQWPPKNKRSEELCNGEHDRSHTTAAALPALLKKTFKNKRPSSPYQPIRSVKEREARIRTLRRQATLLRSENQQRTEPGDHKRTP